MMLLQLIANVSAVSVRYKVECIRRKLGRKASNTVTFPIIKSSFHRVLLSTFYFILYFYIDDRVTQCEENVVLKGNNSVFIFISTVNYPGIFIIGDIN